jgi:hypothetical protein
MKHLFVPYELAVKLKEKGFDEPCLAGYLIADDGQFSIYGLDTNHENLSEIDEENWLNAPLYQQALDFLFKKLDSFGLKLFSDESGSWIDYNTQYDDEYSFNNLSEAIEQALKLIP